MKIRISYHNFVGETADWFWELHTTPTRRSCLCSGGPYTTKRACVKASNRMSNLLRGNVEVIFVGEE
jgi:hypothetical protein